MNVLLLQTRRQSAFGMNGFIATEPLGLEVVAASLQGHRVRILDLFEDCDVAREIHDFKPQAVGIGCSFTTDVPRAVSLARMVKSIAPEAYTFVGGHHPSQVPDDFFHPFVDAVVIGDGEATAPHLIDALDGKRDPVALAGLAINTPEGQVRNPERPLIRDMDRLPIPARNLTRRYRKRYYLGTRHPIVTMETSRGCPYRCHFCSVWKFHRGTVRFMSPERVVEEILTLPRGDVLFTDDNFLADAERAYRIADLIERRGIRRRWIFQARSDSIVRHPEVVSKWASAGLAGVFIGFEKTDQSDLDGVNKHNSPQNNEEALRFLQSQRIDVYASFIVDPTFGRAEFDSLSRYIRKFKIRDPYFSVLTPLPGTELFDKMKQRITTNNHEFYDLLHAVLPTELPLDQFYQQFAGLYRDAYLKGQNKWNLLVLLVSRFFSGHLSISRLTRLNESVRLLMDPQAYLSIMSTAPSKSLDGCSETEGSHVL